MTTPSTLTDPAAMLATLHLAYRHLLDELPLPDGSPRPPEERRLTVDEQRELGRRLAEYWGIKSL